MAGPVRTVHGKRQAGTAKPTIRTRHSGVMHPGRKVEVTAVVHTTASSNKKRSRQFEIANHTITTDDITPILQQEGDAKEADSQDMKATVNDDGKCTSVRGGNYKKVVEKRTKPCKENDESDLDELFSPLHEQFSSFSEGDDTNEDDLDFLGSSHPKRFLRQASWDADSGHDSTGSLGLNNDRFRTDSENKWEPIFSEDDLVIRDNEDFWKDVETSETDSMDDASGTVDVWTWQQQQQQQPLPIPQESQKVERMGASLADFIDSNIVADTNQPLSNEFPQYKIKWLSFRDSEGNLSFNATDNGSQHRISKRRIKKKVIRRKSAVEEMFCPGVGIGEFMIL